jgi:hypothetical protein
VTPTHHRHGMITPGIAPRHRRDTEIGTQPLIAAGVAKHEVDLTRINIFPALSTGGTAREI